MPLTQKIIEEVVRREVKSGLVPINEKLDKMSRETDQRLEIIDQRFESIDKRFESIDKRFESLEVKIDKLTEIVVDLAGQFRKFDEEQVVLAGQVSNLTDRVEKLELAIN